MTSLAERINDALPQTQCTRCGYPDCASYASAVASNEADINQCPPGGEEGIVRLSLITGRDAKPLNPENGTEAPRLMAVIDEAWCIGCTLCIKACPTDAILGSNKVMHTIIEPYCTGCELCVPVCPVDCISLEPITESTGWDAWSEAQAATARARYESRKTRLAQQDVDHSIRMESKALEKLADLPAHTHGAEGSEADRKRSIIEAALAKSRAAREKRSQTP